MKVSKSRLNKARMQLDSVREILLGISGVLEATIADFDYRFGVIDIDYSDKDGSPEFTAQLSREYEPCEEFLCWAKYNLEQARNYIDEAAEEDIFDCLMNLRAEGEVSANEVSER